MWRAIPRIHRRRGHVPEVFFTFLGGSSVHEWNPTTRQFDFWTPPNGFDLTVSPALPEARLAIKRRVPGSFEVAVLNTSIVLTYSGTQLSGWPSGEVWTATFPVYQDYTPLTTVTADYGASASNELYGVWSTPDGFVSVSKSHNNYVLSQMPGDTSAGTLTI